MIPAAIQCVQGDDISGQTHVDLAHRHRLAGLAKLFDATAELLDHEDQHGLETGYGLLGEERVEGGAACAVQSVICRSKAGAGKVELIDVEDRFVARFVLRVLAAQTAQQIGLLRQSIRPSRLQLWNGRSQIAPRTPRRPQLVLLQADHSPSPAHAGLHDREALRSHRRVSQVRPTDADAPGLHVFDH